jgi:DNA-binding NarL/FixJ family response regulator
MLITEKIKVAIAEDHKIFRDGIKMALSDKSNLQILWEAENGKELMRQIASEKPDVILMDISMPEMNGIEAIKILRREYSDVKIIVLTSFDDEDTVNNMMEMGANAYLTKTTSPEEIYEAILSCMNNGFYYNPMFNNAMAGKLRQNKNARHFYGSDKPLKFNETEINILQLLAEDKNTAQIAKIIFRSPRTIETIRQNMKSKVSSKTIAGLIMYGLRHKLITA